MHQAGFIRKVLLRLHFEATFFAIETTLARLQIRTPNDRIA